MLSCGIDVGSAQTKCVIIDGNRVVQGRGLVHTGSNLPRASHHALREALRECERHEYDLSIIVGTGFGRFAIPFSHKSVTETICHSMGALYRYPKTRTVLDMGGQDMIAIRLDENGNVVDFAMNDKCAAGTGRFLESLADLIGISVPDMRSIDVTEDEQIKVTNVCSVMAEQEVINHLETGKTIDEILGGVFMAVAQRAASLVRRVGLVEEITYTGGVSQIKGIVRSLDKLLGVRGNAGIDAVYFGALGAALVGLEKHPTGNKISL